MLDLIHRGGLLIWPIIFCSLTGMFIFFQRLLVFRKAEGSLSAVRAVCEMVATDRSSEARELLAGIDAGRILPAERLLIEALAVEGVDRETMETVITHGVEREGHRLERHMGTLATLGNVTPLLGLLGTVVGMVKAFAVVESMGGRVNAAMLAGGIWEAMLTTVFGLSAAIPLILCHNHLENRLNDIQAGLEEVAIAFLKARSTSGAGR